MRQAHKEKSTCTVFFLGEAKLSPLNHPIIRLNLPKQRIKPELGNPVAFWVSFYSQECFDSGHRSGIQFQLLLKRKSSLVSESHQ
jgi:hypothetical protein